MNKLYHVFAGVWSEKAQVWKCETYSVIADSRAAAVKNIRRHAWCNGIKAYDGEFIPAPAKLKIDWKKKDAAWMVRFQDEVIV